MCSAMYAQESCEETFGQVKPEHVGPVGFGDGGVGVGLHEDAVAAYGNGSSADGFYHFGVPSSDARYLVRLLQGVGDVNNHGNAVALHDGYATEVDDEVLIAEGGAAFGKHDVVVSKIGEFVHHMSHGLGGKELSFLHIDATSCPGGGFEEGGLAAEKGGYLQNVYEGGRHLGIMFTVNVGNNGNPVSVADGLEDVKTGLVADAGEGIDTGSVGFAIGGFECKRYL